VLFLLFGSSAAGKTAALEPLRVVRPELAIHDFDEVGVPSDAETGWRQRENEQWVRRALEYQAQGVDVVLAGQTPLGELLAAPSAPLLEAISACLVDCDDETRLARLDARRREQPARRSGHNPQVLVVWAEWMRRHAADPTWRPDVIRDGDPDGQLVWQRWSDWQAGDPRWRVRVVDTSSRPPEAVAAELSEWIDEERAAVRAGTHPLTGGRAWTTA
jgi:hypothetical protein